MFVVTCQLPMLKNPINNLWSWYLLNFLYGTLQISSSPQNTTVGHEDQLFQKR